MFTTHLKLMSLCFNSFNTIIYTRMLVPQRHDHFFFRSYVLGDEKRCGAAVKNARARHLCTKFFIPRYDNEQHNRIFSLAYTHTHTAKECISNWRKEKEKKIVTLLKKNVYYLFKNALTHHSWYIEITCLRGRQRDRRHRHGRVTILSEEEKFAFRERVRSQDHDEDEHLLGRSGVARKRVCLQDLRFGDRS